MNSSKQCSKTVLAGESGCRVVYCHDCRVAEIEVGSVSLRLKEDAFRNFSGLIATAIESLDDVAKLNAAFGQELRHVH